MKMVKKTIELDQDAIDRTKAALNARTEKEAVNFVLKLFDTDVQLAGATLDLAGRLNVVTDIENSG